MWSARIWPPVCGHRSVAAMTWPPGRVTRIWPPGSGRLDVAAKQGRQDMATKMWPLGQGLQDVITRTRPSENGRQEFVTRKWPPVREKNIMKKLGAWNVSSCSSSSSGGEGETIMKKLCSRNVSSCSSSSSGGEGGHMMKKLCSRNVSSCNIGGGGERENSFDDEIINGFQEDNKLCAGVSSRRQQGSLIPRGARGGLFLSSLMGVCHEICDLQFFS